MDYPAFETPYFTNMILIAADAVLHVVMSHGVAIGGMTAVAFSEYRGWRQDSSEWEQFARGLAKPTVIMITGIGAVSGVGIWFISNAIAPRAIGSLLRVFFYPWLLEWGVFLVEVALILVYFLTWHGWSGTRKRWHVMLGWGYVGFAVLSAFLITGILGFMLTPDGWPWNRGFWGAFFNATYPPQLVVRLSEAAMAGAVYVTVYAYVTRQSQAIRAQVLHCCGAVVLAAVAVYVVGMWWYFAVVPAAFKPFIVSAILTHYLSQQSWLFPAVNIAAILGLLAFALLALRRRVRILKWSFWAFVLPVAFLMTEYEFVREFIRGPYLMPGYMYSNEVLLEEVPYADQRGLLAGSYWFNAVTQEPTDEQRGAFAFWSNCSQCHPLQGLNSIERRFKGVPKDGIYVILQHADQMVPFMPPFSGTDDERRITADFLYRLTNGQLEEAPSARFDYGRHGAGHE